MTEIQNKLKSFFLCTSILLLFVQSYQLVAQNVFVAKVSKTSLPQNDRLRIDFEMNFDGDYFEAPDFNGFTVYSGPSQTVRQSWINGKGSMMKIYSYILIPNQQGKIKIESAIVKYRGEEYNTDPVVVEITKPIDKPKDPNNLAIDLSEELKLVAEVSNGSPYLNQGISVVYKLYLGYNIGINNFKEVNKPVYNNFWTQNIEIKDLQIDETVINGRRTRVVVLKKVVMYPQKSGNLEIEPLALELDVVMPTNKRDFWGRVIVENDTKRISAGARTINVKSLPDNAPAEFDGAVGNLSFEVIPNKTALEAGESLEIKLVAKGNGNLKLFKLPKLKVPNAIEMYDPVFKEEVNTTLSGMQGAIADTYTLVPQSAGNFVIQPLEFVYFDTGSRSYKTITSKPIEINVTQGGRLLTSTTQTTQKETVVSSEQFRFIQTKTKLTPTNQKSFIETWAFPIALGAPLLMIPLFLIVRKRNEQRASDVVGNRLKANQKLAKKYLQEARNSITNSTKFYEALEKCLHNFLKAKLKVETSEMTKDNLGDILLQKQVTQETLDQLLKLIQNAEMARYASFSENDIQTDYNFAVECITNIDKQFKK